MEEYYHFTKYEYLENINKHGLVTQIGDRSSSVYDERDAIFLSRGKLAAIMMFFSMKDFYDTHTGKNGEDLLNSAIVAIEHYDKLLEKRQKKNGGIDFLRRSIEELKESRKNAVMLKRQVEDMERYSSFEDFFGKGVYLCIRNLSDVKYDTYDFHNCWTYENIDSENINVVILRDKKTGEIIDDKNYIINYFMATTSLDDLFTEYKRTVGMTDDKYTAHDVMKDYNMYYKSHMEEFNDLKNNYELIELPIKEYMDISRKNMKR